MIDEEKKHRENKVRGGDRVPALADLPADPIDRHHCMEIDPAGTISGW